VGKKVSKNAKKQGSRRERGSSVMVEGEEMVAQMVVNEAGFAMAGREEVGIVEVDLNGEGLGVARLDDGLGLGQVDNNDREVKKGAEMLVEDVGSLVVEKGAVYGLEEDLEREGLGQAEEDGNDVNLEGKNGSADEDGVFLQKREMKEIKRWQWVLMFIPIPKKEIEVTTTIKGRD
jgi:hypothetical protein